MNKTPPKYLLKFFRWFCHPELVEDIEGDLWERFDRNPSKWRFGWEVMKLFRPSLIRPFGGRKLNYYGMFKHNLLITIRGFLRYKSSFLINLIGLSTGLACTLLIYLWVQDELAVDKFHENDDRLYSVMGNFHNPEGINTWNGMPMPLAATLENEFPEIEKSVCATDPMWRISFTLNANEKNLEAIGMYASDSFFDLFSYELLKGEKSQVLADQNAIVISDRLAKKTFGDTKDLIGKRINWESTYEKGQAVITGIFNDPPENSTAQFDFLLPSGNYLKSQQDNWYAPTAVTYVLLKPGANPNDVSDKISDAIDQRVEGSDVDLFLKKYSDSYLYGDYENGVQAGGRIEYVQLFSTIAAIILIIACINFMNLSTARASRRVKELGIKKASGATRGNLVAQYLSESVCLALLSLIVAVVFVSILLPQFNSITGKALSLALDKETIWAGLGVTLFAGLISGSYPALYLSGFSPMSALSGKVKNSRETVWIRKGLVIFQFSVSIILILSVFVVYKQVNFMQNKDLGYDRENVILFESSGKITASFETFLTELKSIPGVINASAMTNSMFSAPGGELQWNGSESSSNFSRFMVYEDFIETMGLTLLEGETFSSQTVSKPGIIINESAAKLMNLDDPIGTNVKFWNSDRKIIGVVKDFNFQSLHEGVSPMFFHRYPTEYLMNIVVSLKPGDQQNTILEIADLYEEFNPGIALNHRHLKDDYKMLYESENKVGVLSKYFAGMAIIISCLGLFGLASFTAERRTKEIGIRKVLGSSVFQIIKMLSKEFTKIVLISIVIGLPIGYLIANNWLQDFAYSINLEWWFFGGAGLLGLLISWVTVGIQILKAARANPVESLKSE